MTEPMDRGRAGTLDYRDDASEPSATQTRAARSVPQLELPDSSGRTRSLLAPILLVQAAISLWLSWQNTAFLDEATYINAGHAELAAFLHNAQIPPFATSFSGAPIVYPPLAAIADSLGGLAGARFLSLIFMLAATVLVFNTADRLFGPTTATFAALLWAVSAPTLFLGAFATYDAMALCALAGAASCAIASAQSTRHRAGLLVAASLLLVLADAAKYAATLWDPVVVVAAALVAARARGARSGVRTGVLLAVGTAAVIAGLVLAGGAAYRTGINFTTLERQRADFSRLILVLDSARLIGVVVVLGFVGAVLLTKRLRRADPYLCALAWVFVAAAFLAPIEQLRLATITSLYKHDGFGIWFTALPAGYAASRLWERLRARAPSSPAEPDRRYRARLAAFLAAVLLVAGAGALQGYLHFKSWPDSSAVQPIVKRALLANRSLATVGRDGYGPPYLAEDSSVLIYYLHSPMRDWDDTYFLRYDHHRGFPAFRIAIKNHFFHLVVLSFTETAALDTKIQHVLYHSYGWFRLARNVSEGPGGFGHKYQVWIYITGLARSQRYEALAIQLNSTKPATSLPTGGTTIKLSGSGFTVGKGQRDEVCFGATKYEAGSSCEAATVVSDKEITATIPKEPAGFAAKNGTGYVWVVRVNEASGTSLRKSNGVAFAYKSTS